MINFVKDSKNIKEKLHDIIPWEVLLLNKLYSSSSHVFDSLANIFQQQEADFIHLRTIITQILGGLCLEACSRQILTTSISSLIDAKHSISEHISQASPTFLSHNMINQVSQQILTDNKTEHSLLNNSLRAEIHNLEAVTNLEGKIYLTNDLDTLMNICNFLIRQDLSHASFQFIKVLDLIKSTDERHFLSEELRYIDVLILSALGRCRSWSRIIKDKAQSERVIPNLIKWTEDMKREYKEFLDFQVHYSLLSKRHLRETAKKHILKNYHSGLIEAVKVSNYEEVSQLLQAGVSVESIDPDDKNKPALHIACQNGDMNMVKLLEKHGCDFEALDYEQLTPIFYAISSENLELIKCLLSKRVDLEHKDSQDRTPFYWACCQCSCQIVDFLHQQGCNVNALSKLNRSPLTKAAYLGRIDIVKLLLSYDETLFDLPGNKGRTALHNAVWGKAGGREGKIIGSKKQEDCPEAAQLLIERGAEINLKDFDGNTPLAIAAASHAEKSICLLLSIGADLDTQNNLGETPLSQASKWGHIEICKMMMENYHPNPLLKNTINLDCFETAVVNKHLELSIYFLDKLHKKVVEDDSYFNRIIELTVQNPEEDQRYIFLSHVLEIKGEFCFPSLSEDTLAELIKLKDEKILKLLLDYMNIWTAKVNKEVFKKIEIMIREAIKLNWIKCCRVLFSEYPKDISNTNWNMSSLGNLETLKDGDLMFLVENFNIDIFTNSEKGESLMHALVGKRNISLLLELLTLLGDIAKGKRKTLNNYMVNIDMSYLKDLVITKNTDGYSVLDFALIHKYYEIHGILLKFLGEDLEGSVHVPKYQVIVKSYNTSYIHGQKEILINKEKQLKELQQRIALDIVDEPEKHEIINTKVESKDRDTKSIYRVQQREIDYLKEILLPKDTKEKSNKPKGKEKKKSKKDTNDNQNQAEIKQDTYLKNEALHGIINQRVVTFIDDENALATVYEEIKEYTLLGVDTEYYLEDREKRVGFICLLQLSTIKQDYLVDCIRLHKVIKKHLAAIFRSEDIVKVFHGCESDLKWLKADFDIDVINLFDTSRALMLINSVDLPYSLAYLTSTFLGLNLDKSYQKADWRVRPLPKGMSDYARNDSCVLLYLWYILNGELRYKGQDKMIKMAKKMTTKCWRTLEKSTRPNVEVIAID